MPRAARPLSGRLSYLCDNPDMWLRGFAPVKPFRAAAALVGLLSLLPGCGGIVDPSKNTVVTFTDSLDVGGSGPTHLFSASKNGEFFITLTSLTPDTTAAVGIIWGQQVSGGCSQISGNSFAQVNRQAIGGPIDKADYCVVVVDTGASILSGRQTYTIRVSHP
jgi:hypothetical protein